MSDAIGTSGLNAVVPRAGPTAAPGRPRLVRTVGSGRRYSMVVVLAATIWCLWDAGVGRRRVTNTSGFGLIGRFFSAALHPRIDSGYVTETIRSAAVTVSYAAVASFLSVVIGLLGAALLSERMWDGHLASNGRRRATWARVLREPLRLMLTIPRGVHEAVWALLLVNVLGRDPLVAVLAIGIPFGATTAKVYAELIDESARGPHTVLRGSGGSRLGSLLYGVVPTVSRDFIAYGFYRFECAIRSAVILGMIGAGGIGFQLGISFQGLQYREMWTSIYAIIALGVAAEWWSAALRSNAGAKAMRRSVTAGSMVLVASWSYLGLRPWNLWSPRTRRLAGRLFLDLTPPRLSVHGLPGLLSAARESLQMSFLAIVIGTLLALPLAYAGARSGRSVARHAAVRLVALAIRSIPPTVWALLVLFVILPGVLPGALALGIYTAGVLARLFGDVLESSTSGARTLLHSAGAKPLTVALYSTIPEVAPAWTSLALYRWEVAAREVVVVGVVGAGGLGRLLSAQVNAFAFAAMTTTIGSMIMLTFLVDRVSLLARRSLR